MRLIHFNAWRLIFIQEYLYFLFQYFFSQLQVPTAEIEHRLRKCCQCWQKHQPHIVPSNFKDLHSQFDIAQFGKGALDDLILSIQTSIPEIYKISERHSNELTTRTHDAREKAFGELSRKDFNLYQIYEYAMILDQNMSAEVNWHQREWRKSFDETSLTLTKIAELMVTYQSDFKTLMPPVHQEIEWANTFVEVWAGEENPPHQYNSLQTKVK